jgi:hypothetical protein
MGSRSPDGLAALLFDRAYHDGAAPRRCQAPECGQYVVCNTWFKGSIDFERVHPLESGFVRLKFRCDHRPGLPIDPAWRFYPRYWTETVYKLWNWVALYVRLRRIYLSIKYDPKASEYSDLALTPVVDDEAETHELFRSEAARTYLGQEKRLEQARRGAVA